MKYKFIFKTSQKRHWFCTLNNNHIPNYINTIDFVHPTYCTGISDQPKFNYDKRTILKHRSQAPRRTL